MQQIDPSRFHLHNVTDTCAAWHVLSSRLLYATARTAGCYFILTDFVHYECFYKRGSQNMRNNTELQTRLKHELQRGGFIRYSLDIEDLQDIEILEKRKNLGKGELSAIACAKKLQQAFLTDDQKARKLAETELRQDNVQTTSHLFGWLFFRGFLGDGDKRTIIDEHNESKRKANDKNSLEHYFEEMYQRALTYRLMANGGNVREEQCGDKLKSD